MNKCCLEVEISNNYLNGNGLSNGCDDTQRPFGLVGTMSPESMSAARNSKSTVQVQPHS